MLGYVFALLHDALTLLRSVIPSIYHRSGHISPVTASHTVVIAPNLSISIIASICYSISIIMCLLFTA
jgi:hypothetical protein